MPRRRLYSQTLFAALPLLLMTARAGDLDRISATQTVPFANTGTLRIERFSGAIHIQGWDRPEVEITLVKSTYRPKDHAKLVRVETKAERHDNEVVISTVTPRRADIQVEYYIQAPRNLALVIDHGKGGVYVTDMAGDIQAKVRDGQITLRLPENAQYTIQAHTTIGEVFSDFEGTGKFNIHFGESFKENEAGHKLDLRTGFGDILILKTPYHPKPLP